MRRINYIRSCFSLNVAGTSFHERLESEIVGHRGNVVGRRFQASCRRMSPAISYMNFRVQMCKLEELSTANIGLESVEILLVTMGNMVIAGEVYPADVSRVCLSLPLGSYHRHECAPLLIHINPIPTTRSWIAIFGIAYCRARMRAASYILVVYFEVSEVKLGHIK